MPNTTAPPASRICPTGMHLDSFRIVPAQGGVWSFEADPDLGYKIARARGATEAAAAESAESRTAVVVMLAEGEQGGRSVVVTDSEATISDLEKALEVLTAMHQAHAGVRGGR